MESVCLYVSLAHIISPAGVMLHGCAAVIPTNSVPCGVGSWSQQKTKKRKQKHENKKQKMKKKTKNSKGERARANTEHVHSRYWYCHMQCRGHATDCSRIGVWQTAFASEDETAQARECCL